MQMTIANVHHPGKKRKKQADIIEVSCPTAHAKTIHH